MRWWHDGRRHDGDTVGQHTIRLASPTRDPQRLLRLTQEHLQRLVLAAPVLDIGLHADECQPLRGDTAALFALDGAAGPHGLSLQADALHTTAAQHAQRDALLSLLDRLSVRLGEQHVQQGGIVADHRLEHAQHWQPAVRCAPTTLSRGASSLSLPGWPQPCWVLPQPLPLALAHEPGGLRERPLYQGPLRLLAGPHRIEAGWWDDQAGHASVARDYYLASSAHAGLLWIYKARPASGPTPHTTGPWFLHGVFA